MICLDHMVSKMAKAGMQIQDFQIIPFHSHFLVFPPNLSDGALPFSGDSQAMRNGLLSPNFSLPPPAPSLSNPFSVHTGLLLTGPSTAILAQGRAALTFLGDLGTRPLPLSISLLSGFASVLGDSIW